MLWQLSGLNGFHVQATDGRCGKIRDFLVSDSNWRVRWIVDDIGSWVHPHKVLLSPGSCRELNEDAQVCPTTLSRERIANCPDISLDPPVALQKVRNTILAEDVPGFAHLPMDLTGVLLPPLQAGESGHHKINYDPHLRSIKEVTGYHVHGVDGTLGEVEDFIMDDDGWRISHLVVRWTNWWNQYVVAVAISAVSAVDWDDKSVRLKVPVQEIKTSMPLVHMIVSGRSRSRVQQTGWEGVI
jgi:hypothetical protein